jgi:hypothetical protein
MTGRSSGRLRAFVAAAAGVVPVAALAPAAALAADPALVPAPDLKPGDLWLFDRAVERGTSGVSDKRLDLRIERVGADNLVVGMKVDGSPNDYEARVMGPDWSQRRLIDGVQVTIGKPMSFPLAVGKTWTIDWVDQTRHGPQTSARHHETYKVVGWERVTTPAGTFRALRIESEDRVTGHFMGASEAIGGSLATGEGATSVGHVGRSGPHLAYGQVLSSFDYVPEVKYWVKTERDEFDGEGVRVLSSKDQLITFKPAS